MLVLRRLLLSLTAIVLILTGTTVPVAALDTGTTGSVATSALAERGQRVPTNGRTGCSATLWDGDRRLGPEVLSTVGETGQQLAGYRRTGDLNRRQFFEEYWDPALNSGNGSWIYPTQNGYQLGRSGRAVKAPTTLAVGQRVDRYGSEYGTFLAPYGIPYASRSIPPSNLVGTPAQGCNYSSYQVVKPFTVYAGPIAAWFGQPGGGVQYQLSTELIAGAPTQLNVGWLVTAGYLERLPA